MEGRVGSVVEQGKLLRSPAWFPPVTRGHGGVESWGRTYKWTFVCEAIEYKKANMCHVKLF